MRPVSNSGSDIEYLSVEQGFPSNAVSSIQADHAGRLWFATGGGLVCYDGNRILTFGKDQGLVSDRLTDLLIDSRGYLWAGSAEGFSVTNGVLVHNYSREFKNGLTAVSCIYEDSKGDIWITVEGNGVFRFDGQYFYQYGPDQGLETAWATSVVEDVMGRYWVGAYDKEPSIISGDTIFNTTYWGPLWTYIELEAIRDKEGDLWYATYGPGLCKIDFGDQKVYEIKPSPVTNAAVAQAVAIDSAGNVWMGLETSGVYCIPADGSPESHFNTEDGLTDNTILDIFANSDGTIWVGTLAGGVCKINPKGFRNYNEREGIANNTVASLLVDHNGTVFAGFWPGGYYHLYKGSWRQYHDDMHSERSIILDIAEDQNNDIWLSIHGFGFRRLIRDTLNGEDFIGTEYLIYGPKSINPSVVYNMLAGPKGGMYFFDTNLGLYVLNEDSVSVYNTGSNFPENRLFSGDFTKNGELVVSTYDHGISRIRNEKIKQITTREGLLSNKPRTVFTDSKNQIWIGYTTKGLSCMTLSDEGEHIVNFDESDGWAPCKVSSISEDSLDRIWLGTNNGIFCAIPCDTVEKGYRFNHLTISDGLRVMDFLNHSGVIDGENTIWFGSRKGVTSISLDELHFSDQPAKLNWTSVKVNDKHIGFGSKENSLKSESHKFEYEGTTPFSNMPSQLKLDYFQNNLVFQFSAVQWKKDDHILFSHRLIGLTENWSAEHQQREISYSNLSSGNYTLELRSRLEGDSWGEPISFEFEIYPPWWQTWWFRLLMLLLLGGIILQIFLWRTRQLRKRQAELEETVKERTAEIAHQKTVIEEKQKETMDSINYAKRIQYALLAHDELMEQNLPDHFVLFLPKDVVSGDFYWATRKLPNEQNHADLFYLAVCDSTGHGVPGAFMSLLNISFLNEAINEKGIYDPGQILDHTRKRLIENISKDGHRDGMDGILICIDRTSQRISYAAGNNSPVIISQQGIQVLPADKMPVGKSEKTQNFITHQVDFSEGDMLFLPTDGYSDQFGGTGIKPAGKKFKRSNLNQLFETIGSFDTASQKAELSQTLTNWKGEFEQVDDITIIGIRLEKKLFQLP